MTTVFPSHFIQTTLDLFGARGQAWLDGLPAMLSGLEQRWQIRILDPFPLSYNYVAPAVRSDGSHVVVKCGVVNPELISEIVALKHYDGRGIVRLLDAEADEGILLLEHLEPGEPLADLPEDETATRIAAQVMKELWVPAPQDDRLCTAEKWSRGLERLRITWGGGTGPFPVELVERTEKLHEELLASAGPMMLLHGDLHHWNILSAQRRPWLALDPKGVVGEAEFEIGPWMFNQRIQGADKAALRRQADMRLGVFCEMLGFDRQKVLAWSFARAVLSAWWSYEDHRQVEHNMLFFAGVLAEMLDGKEGK